MISAFLNSVKIPELRRRILFTLAVIVIVRLGAAITTPGVNQGVLQEWFRSSLSQRTGGGLAALFNLFSGGALENCAVFSLGIMPYISASIMMQLLTAVIPQLGRLAREDGGRQKIMQLTRYTTLVLCIFQGYLLALSFQHPESYHTMLPGITDTIRHIGFDVVGRSNRRAWYRGRHLSDHHDRDCCAVARCAGAGLEDFCSIGARSEPGEPDGAGAARVGSRLCHRRSDRDYARRPQNYCAVREASSGAKNVRRPNAIHAFESELCGRDADHLCVGAALVPCDDRELRLQEQSHCESHCCSAFDRVAALCRSCGNDLLLQLLLGRHAVSTNPNRGRSEKIRRLRPRRATGK